MDRIIYNKKQDKDLSDHEELCRRCGKCCGAETDPCSNLAKDPAGKYYCRSYESRLGFQRTVSGRTFTCVQIRDVLAKGLPCEGCGYSA